MLGELVEDPKIATVSGIAGGDINAGQSIADIQKAPRLPARAIDRQGQTCHGLDQKAVQHRTENMIIMERGPQLIRQLGLICIDAIDHALVQIRRPHAPNTAGEFDIMGIMHLREVIKAAGLFRVQHPVLAPVMLDLQPAFLDIDIRRAVFAHGAQLDQMGIGAMGLHGEHQIQIADDIVLLGHDRRRAVLHGIRRRGLFGVMHDGVRLGLAQQIINKAVISQIADFHADRLTSLHFVPVLDPVMQGGNRQQRLDPVFKLPLALGEVVRDPDRVANGGEMHCGGPAKITVAAQNKDFHEVEALEY